MFLRTLTCLLLLGHGALGGFPGAPGGGGGGGFGAPPSGGMGGASNAGSNTASNAGQSSNVGGQNNLPGQGGGGTTTTTTTVSPGQANLGAGANQQQQQQQQQQSNTLNQQMGGSSQIGGGALPPIGGPIGAGGGMASKCSSCPVVANADYNCKTALMDQTKYTCQPGYEGNSNKATVTCNLKGKWEPDPFTFKCARKMCTKPDPLINGAVDGKTQVATGDTIKYKCNTGYTGSQKDMTVKCLDTKKYESPSFKCNKIDCGSPPSLANGKPSSQATAHNTQLTYICNNGYELKNGHQILCGNDGKWAPAKLTMTCEMVQCPRPKSQQDIPANSDSSEGSNYPKWKSTLTFKCKSGYVSSTGSDVTVTCTANGQWTTPLQTVVANWKCERPGCKAPPTVSHANHDGTKTKYDHRDSVKYSCKTGYTGSGSSSCNAGTWTKPTCVCKIVSCGRLKMYNKFFAVSESTDYPNFKSTVTYSCVSGYKSKSGAKAHITCQANGQWNPSESSIHKSYQCIQKQCPKPLPNVALAKPVWSSATIGSRASYRCKSYHDIKGNAVIVCQKDETWQTPSFTCVLQTCGTPPQVNNAISSIDSKTVVSHGGSVTYTCKSGFRMVNKKASAIKCVGKKWDMQPSFTCESTACDASKIPTITKATRSPATASGKCPHGTQVEYKCAAGYYGTTATHTIKCENAKWTKLNFACKAITCEGIPELQNAHARNPTGQQIFQYNAVLTYFCDNGKISNGGKNSVKCQVTAGSKKGSWSTTSFKCFNPKSCGKEPGLAHAVATPSANSHVHDTVVTYKCNTCFIQSSSDNSAVCQNGKWQGPAITCKPVVCPVDSMTKKAIRDAHYKFLSVTKLNYCMSVATFTCEAGYTPSPTKTATVTCGTNAKWTNINLKCTIVDCGSLSIANGKPTNTDTKYGSKIGFTCNNGYTLTNKQTLSCCADGKWSPANKMKCVPAGCGKPTTVHNTEYKPAYTSYSHNAVVKYKCINGYAGAGVATCNCGSWTNPTVKCVGTTCKPPASIKDTTNDVGTRKGFQKGDKVTYRCKLGMYGNPLTVRCLGGSWTTGKMDCKAASLSSLTLFTDPWDCQKYGSTGHKNDAQFILYGKKGTCTVSMSNIIHNYKQTIYLSKLCKKPIGEVTSVHTSHKKGYGFRMNMVYICDQGSCYTFRCGYRKDHFTSCVINSNTNKWGSWGKVKKTIWGTKGILLNSTVGTAKANFHVVYTWTSQQYGSETKGEYMIRFIDSSNKYTNWYTVNKVGVPLMGWNCRCQDYYLRSGYYYNTREPRCAEAYYYYRRIRYRYRVGYRRYKYYYRTVKYLRYKNSKKCTWITVQAFYYNLPQGFVPSSIELAPRRAGFTSYYYNDGWYFHGLNMYNLKNKRHNYVCGVNINHRFCALDYDKSYNFAFRSIVLKNIDTAHISSQKIAQVTTYTSYALSASCINNIGLTFWDKAGNTCTVKSFNGATSSTRSLVRSRTQDFHIVCQKKMGAVTKISVTNNKDKSSGDGWWFYKICIKPNIRYTNTYCYACGSYYSPCKLYKTKSVPEPKYTQYYKIYTKTLSVYRYRLCYSRIQVDFTDTTGLKCTSTLNLKSRRTAVIYGKQYWNVACVTMGRKMGKMRYVKFSNKRTYPKPWGRWFMLEARFHSKHPSLKSRGRQRSFTRTFYSRYVYYFIYYSTFTISVR